MTAKRPNSYNGGKNFYSMSDILRIGIYGGAFDPPHAAHVMVAAYALCCLDVDRLFVIPCAGHPFAKSMSPFDVRMRMAVEAFGFLGSSVQVLDIESRLPVPSYTINTVEALKRQFPGASFALLIGSDNAVNMDKWHRIGELRGMVDIMEVNRMEGEGVVFPPISSTMIRERVRAGLPIDGLVPVGVQSVIQELKLYSGTGK